MMQQRHAYLIGANGPQHTRITPLQYAEKDVQRLKEAFNASPCNFIRVQGVIADASLDVIADLEEFSENCQDTDLLVVHFSGHAKSNDGELYLIRNNTAFQQNGRLRFATTIKLRDIKDVLDRCRARHKLLILDCCYSGTALGGGAYRGNDEFEEPLKQLKGSTSAILTACSFREKARELDILDNNQGGGFLSWVIASSCTYHFNAVAKEDALSLTDIWNWLENAAMNLVNRDLPQQEHIPRPHLLNDRVAGIDNEIWFTNRRRNFRNGTFTTEQIQREELALLQQEEFLQQYCFGANVEDFESIKIQAYASLQRDNERLPMRDIRELCKRLGFTSSQYTPRRSAVLAFHCVPSRYLPSALIRVTMRGLSGEEPYLRDDIEGPLSEQADRAIKWLEANLNTVSENVGSGQRIDRCEIPGRALRELVVNAILHRNYNARESIHIEITPQQVTITNPGQLDVEIEHAESPFSYQYSHPQNPALLRVLVAQRWAEGRSLGFKIIREEFEKYKLPLPEIYNLPNNLVQIVIRRPDIRMASTVTADSSFLDLNVYDNKKLQEDAETYLKHIEQKYRYHKFAGIILHGSEDKAPELNGVYVPPRISLQEDIRPALDKASPTDFFALLEQYSYLVLLGEPGSGKSTLTAYLTWSYAKANLEAFSNSSEFLPLKPLPLRIELRFLSEVRRQNPEYSFLSYASQVLLKRENVEVPIRFFETLLERQEMVVIFDGLDEILSLSERRQLVDEVEMFVQRYSGNRILVTSRPIGYDLASLSNMDFQHAEIQRFDDQQLQQFLENWYRYVLHLSPLPADSRQELELFFVVLKENRSLHRLAVNPLLLTVMTALHRYERLPDERVLIYDKCADLLLDTWGRLKYEGARWKEMKLGTEDQKACLAHLGFVLHQRAQELTQEEEKNIVLASDTAFNVTKSFLRKEIRFFLTSQNLLTGAEQHAEVERLLEIVSTEAGLIVEHSIDENGEPLYGFVHRSFQEYFAALDVLNRYQQEDSPTIVRQFLADHVHDPHWQEVILLLFGKFKHRFATNLLRFILEGKTRRSIYSEILLHDLFFVANCLVDGIIVDQVFASEVITRLSQVVQKSPFPSQLCEAMAVILALSRTKHYSEQSKRMLQAIQDYPDDFSWQGKVAKAIYQPSLSGSEEQLQNEEGLKELLQRKNLLLEREAQVGQDIYNTSSSRPEAQREGFQSLNQFAQNTNTDLEMRLNLALLPFESRNNNFEERVQAMEVLLSLTEKENARKLLEARWRFPSLIENRSIGDSSQTEQDNDFVSSIPAICELTRQDIVPLRARDQLYQLLRSMVPLFVQIDSAMLSTGPHKIEELHSPKE